MTLRAWGCSVEFDKDKLHIVGRNMAGGRPSLFNSFARPNCKALYHIVKVEAGPETVFQEAPCRVCAAPLVGREGNFVLKYFLLREAARVQKWRRRTEKPTSFPSGRGEPASAPSKRSYRTRTPSRSHETPRPQWIMTETELQWFGRRHIVILRSGVVNSNRPLSFA